MPGFNQKGPIGEGAMTGRRMGRCTNFGANQPKQPANTETQSEENTDEKLPENTLGRGMGLRRGMGLGKGMGSVREMDLGRSVSFGRGNCGRGQGMGRQNRNRGNV